MTTITLTLQVPCAGAVPTLKEVQRAYVASVLENSKSKIAAAITLGTDRRTLYRWIKAIAKAAAPQ